MILYRSSNSNVSGTSIIIHCFPENLLAYFRKGDCPIRNEWVGLFVSCEVRKKSNICEADVYFF